MLQQIYLPENVEIKEDGPNTASFTIQPYHPGYGPTIGNALRRVLLSSLPGSAIVEMKVGGADHEFSGIDGVKEDIVSIMLNVKGVYLSSTSDEPVEIRLTAEGKKKVKAGDFETPPEVTITNPEQYIATLTSDKAKIDLICSVERGRGYVPSETRDSDARDIGTVALDAAFTPVQRVSFSVEHARVGQTTNYHALKMTIATDGTITPKDALKQAASILRDHFEELTGDFDEKLTGYRPYEVEETTEQDEPQEPENTLNLLQLPSRVHNALERVGITTVDQVMELSDEQISDIPGLGAKAVQDVADARYTYIKRQEEEKDKRESENEEE